ncbi:DUF3817 domain-containing protein [Calidifontibacter indicus]|uniref:Integral membrane protein n=1 Tax=Calidifontibacter indicus TaxID=419650 RepID=A0A3D9UPH2_9MICO|nr:DUF3817 domain-containing protein [Calidifontibacter indicus]REF30333.1 integral membrane protein [Calidifontibacter indicus]
MSEQYPSEQPIEDPARVRGALKFFRIMALIAGVALLVLVLEMVLKRGMGNDALSWWSPVHGLLFMGFVASVYNLGTKLRWPMGRMVGYVLTAFVPLLSFWLEHKVTREVQGQLAVAAPAAR